MIIEGQTGQGEAEESWDGGSLSYDCKQGWGELGILWIGRACAVWGLDVGREGQGEHLVDPEGN